MNKNFVELLNMYKVNAESVKNASDRNAMLTFIDIVSDYLSESERVNEYAERVLNPTNAGYFGECLMAQYLGAKFESNPNAHSDLVKGSKHFEIKTFIGVGGTKPFSVEELAENNGFYFVYYNRKACQVEIRKAKKSALVVGMRYKTSAIESITTLVDTLC